MRVEIDLSDDEIKQLAQHLVTRLVLVEIQFDDITWEDKLFARLYQAAQQAVAPDAATAPQ